MENAFAIRVTFMSEFAHPNLKILSQTFKNIHGNPSSKQIKIAK